MQTSRYYSLILLFCLALLPVLKASHNRAGEITYTRIAPFTTVVAGYEVPVYRYRIMITTYTDDGHGIADKCRDSINFGDGTKGVALRSNGLTGCCNGENCCTSEGQLPCGEIIIDDQPPRPKYTVKKNIFIAEHTYPVPAVLLKVATGALPEKAPPEPLRVM